MILRFDEDGEFLNKIKNILKEEELSRFSLNKFPKLYIELFENYVTDENSIYIKEEGNWYNISLKIDENNFKPILFLGQEKIKSLYEIDRLKKLFDKLPNLFPFASIGTNLYYCFDFNYDNPKIVLFDPNNSFLIDELSEEDLNVKSQLEWINQGISVIFDSFIEILKNLVVDQDDLEDEEYLVDDEFDGWKDFLFVERNWI